MTEYLLRTIITIVTDMLIWDTVSQWSHV